MRIIALRMGKRPIITELPKDLEAMQSFVQGPIERVLLEARIDMWCNEEGLFNCKPNRRVTTTWGYNQVIFGPFFIAAHEGSEIVGLTKQEATEWARIAAMWPRALSSLEDGDIDDLDNVLLYM